MKTFQVKRHLPYSCQQLFDLVRDIESYPDFLPWCMDAKIMVQPTPQILYARLNIGYEMLQSSYISKVSCIPYTSLKVEQHEGPFKILKNQWIFEPTAINKTTVHFHLIFELKSSVLHHLLQKVFEKSSITMMDSFEKRAEIIYK